MKIRAVIAAFFFLALVSAAGFAAGNEYQAGKVIKGEKQESLSHSGGTDAPVSAEVATYHVSIQLGDKVYVVQYNTHSEDDISWIKGKDIQARVSGKAMYVKKVTGKEAQGSILSSAPAGKP